MMKSVDIKKTTTRERVDHTENLEPPERRWDALARMLSSESICIAISIVNKTIYIAANELHNKSQSNKINKSIKTIMNYFHKLANGEEFCLKERESVFKEICTLERLKRLTRQGEIFIPNSLPQEIAESVLKHDQQEERPSVYKFMYDQGRNAAAAGLAYGEWTKIYRDFSKLESSIKAKVQGYAEQYEDEDLLTQDQLVALKSPYIILKNEISPGGVHAEVQILSCIIDLIQNEKITVGKESPQTFYIGISKLCCLHCRTMIEATNIVLVKKNIPIILETRGHHDLDFGDKWICPKIFANGYDMDHVNNLDPLIDHVGYLAKIQIEELIKEKKPRGISMEANQSASDTDSMGDAARIEILNALKRHLNFVTELDQEINTKKTIIDILLIAIDLHNLDSFISLWKEDPAHETKQDVINSMFAAVSAEFKSKTNHTITSEELLKILKDSSFVGKDISKYFKNMDLLKKQIDIQAAPITTTISDLEAKQQAANHLEQTSPCTDNTIVQTDEVENDNLVKAQREHKRNRSPQSPVYP